MSSSHVVALLCAGWVLAGTATPGLAATECGRAEDRAPHDPPVFLGYACRDDDCAAHKAGFAWADRQGLGDPRACADAEDFAFAEGCRAFVEQSVTAEQSGFDWARQNNLADDCLCRGAGPRFAAGCEAWVAGFAR